MWPWEHLAVGYLAYSLSCHLRGDGAPGGWPAVALAVGTQFPDLLDKPLSWSLGVVASGQSVAHSVLLAVPVSALAIGAATGVGRRRVGEGFAVGYLSHLPSDVFYPLVRGARPNVDAVLWPLASAPAGEANAGLLATARRLFDRYAGELLAGEPTPYLAVELGLLVGVVALWVYDGMPPVGALVANATEDAA
ncbi:metal-dependent hydrolase [Halorussus marinus]|uniref:metal-dependent hydrolase n=1 Tax=Halorussus marinus TaxID=2505976 RepID=UPI0010930BFF|nr:metal-dependent hydrolase [Halorussus marinus]